MDSHKRFIEYDLPLAEISEASAHEKNIHIGLPAQFHVWWARRPLASSRATAFAALIDDPGPDHPQERDEIRELIKEMSPWEAVKDGNSPAIRRAREMILRQYGRPPRVLDPFAGGGSIPLEALRLGCETYASDYNPVAVLIEKATLEWPQKFGIEVELPAELANRASRFTRHSSLLTQSELLGEALKTTKVNLLAYLVEKWANVILEEARAEIGRFYPPDPDGSIPVGYLWARTIPCQHPECRAEVPLVRQFWLCNKEGRHIAYRPVVDEKAKRVEFELLEDAAAIKRAVFDPGKGTVSQANVRCPVCGQVTPSRDVRRLAREGQMGARMVVVVLYHSNRAGKTYRLANGVDERVFADAVVRLEKELSDWPYLESPLPDEPIPTPNNQLYRSGGLYYNFTPVILYGMSRWRDLFNSRQQLMLMIFLRRIRNCYDKVRSSCDELLAAAQTGQEEPGWNLDELAESVLGNLALLLGRIVSFNCSLVRWVSQTELVANVYARQALPMLWDFVEVNPFSASTGSCESQVHYMLAYLEKGQAFPSSLKVKAQLGSATAIPSAGDSLDAVLTDPPYYDNVPYAVLSDFFYIWLKRAVGDRFPELLATPVTPKQEEAIADLPLLRGMVTTQAGHFSSGSAPAHHYI